MKTSTRRVEHEDISRVRYSIMALAESPLTGLEKEIIAYLIGRLDGLAMRQVGKAGSSSGRGS